MKTMLYALPILLVGYTLFILIDRWLVKSGMKVKALFNEPNRKSYTPTMKENIKVFSYATLFRIIVFIFSILIFYTMVIHDYSDGFRINDVLNAWKQWDASNYIRISEGYESYTEEGDYITIVFFPLYPCFIKLLNYIIQNQILSGMIVSSICYSLSCVYLYNLVSLDYGKRIAKNTVILLSIFPYSFFFGAIMSESTFLLFSIMSMYYIRTHKWFKASLFGFLTSLSRMMGFILIIPAAIEVCEEYQIFQHIKDIKYIFKTILPKLLVLLFIPMGIVVFLLINYRLTGDFFYFVDIDMKWYSQGYSHFFKIFNQLIEYIQYYDIGMKLGMWIPFLCIVILSYLVLITGVRKHRTIYSTYLLGYIIINTGLAWPLSIGRYFTCAFPLFIFLADFLNKKRNLQSFIIITECILFGITLTQFFVYGNIY